MIAGPVLLTMAITGCVSKSPQTATLSLDSNPTTGYEWRVEQSSEIFDISSVFVQDKADKKAESCPEIFLRCRKCRSWRSSDTIIGAE